MLECLNLFMGGLGIFWGCVRGIYVLTTLFLYQGLVLWSGGVLNLDLVGCGIYPITRQVGKVLFWP